MKDTRKTKRRVIQVAVIMLIASVVVTYRITFIGAFY